MYITSSVPRVLSFKSRPQCIRTFFIFFVTFILKLFTSLFSPQTLYFSFFEIYFCRIPYSNKTVFGKVSNNNNYFYHPFLQFSPVFLSRLIWFLSFISLKSIITVISPVFAYPELSLLLLFFLSKPRINFLVKIWV